MVFTMNFVQPIRDLDKIEEIKALLKERSQRDYFLFFMGINTGLRVSDLLVLKVKDVKNKTHITIKEEKTGKTKRFPLHTIKEDIAAYIKGMKDSSHLFVSREKKNGLKPLSRHQAWKILSEAGAAAGLEAIGTHTLRKTFGYHFYQKYKDIALLQELFNHSAPSVTLRYIGINQDMIDEAMREFKL
ncbi:MAG: site-specific integrase [Oscillospiraceae bacterium]